MAIRKNFEAISENLLTGVHSRPTLGQVRSGQVRDYRVKAQGRIALLFQCLKMNMQMTDDRRALG